MQDTHDAGIMVQANFMFGMPGETRDDFAQTIKFLRENRKYMDSILASQSFCVIDKGTYLYNHPEEFGITGKEHNIYWASNNGENNYAERFRRYEEFCRLALSLGIPETSGVLKAKPDKWRLLGDFFFHQKDYPSAIGNYLNALRYETANRTLFQRLSSCYEETGEYNKAEEALNNSLRLSCGLDRDGVADRKQDIDFNGMESAELAKILKYFSKTGYKSVDNVDLDKMLSGFGFNEKQKSMSRQAQCHRLSSELPPDSSEENPRPHLQRHTHSQRHLRRE